MGYFSGTKMEIPGRKRAYLKFPQWWGYGCFLKLHNVTFIARVLAMVLLIKVRSQFNPHSSLK